VILKRKFLLAGIFAAVLTGATSLWLFFVILVLVHASSFGVNLAYACSCAGQVPISEHVERSSSIFVGIVEDIQPNIQTGGYDVKFSDVSRVWGTWVNDNPSYGKLTVWTSSLGSGDCGYPFEVGQEYLVYTQRDESTNILRVDLCNGTKPFDQAKEDMKVLGPGTDPTLMRRATEVPATNFGRVLTIEDFIVPALLGAGSAAAAWIFLRFRSKAEHTKLAPVFAGIAVALGILFVTSIIYGGYVEDLQQWANYVRPVADEGNLSCSTISGFWPYSKAGLAESMQKDSDLVIAVGTIKNVDMRIVDSYSAIPTPDPTNSSKEIVELEPTGSKIPWKAVTFEVEKYLIDETGNYSKVITFRTSANACVDNDTGELVPLPASFASDPASDPDKSAKYNVGDRSLIEIHRWHGGEYKAEGLDSESTVKLDIDENGYVKADYRTGIDKPIKIEDLENEIARELQRLSN